MLSISRVKPALNIVHIGRDSGVSILFSYDVPVAISNLSGYYVTDKGHSRTTQGHINWFIGGKDRRKLATVVSQEWIDSLKWLPEALRED